MIVLGGGEFGEGIEPAVVVTGGSADDGLVSAAEIVLVVCCVPIGTNAVRPDVFDGGQLELEAVMAQGEVRSDEVVPRAVVCAPHGI